MKSFFNRAFFDGTARLMDVGGVLAWRGTHDPMEATARAMGETFASLAAAVPPIESEAIALALDRFDIVVTIEMSHHHTEDIMAAREESAQVNATASAIISALNQVGGRLHYLSTTEYSASTGTMSFRIEAQVPSGTNPNIILKHLGSLLRYSEIQVSGPTHSVKRSVSPAS
jgi:2-polyprenyl-3-methyl-5-hydroxy-6-metoxy-1,4-benzoquinol methylase